MARIGTSDLDVFPLALGGNVFGWTADADSSHQILNAYLDAGGNFIDTADVYSAWIPGNGGGVSEEIIGGWLRDKRRDDVVIATKVGMYSEFPGLSAANIRAAADASLKRLGVDHIDLYYAHKDDADTPLPEIVTAFDALVTAGKVRYLAVSNLSPERIEEWVSTAAELGLALPIASQPLYNLVEREGFEKGEALVLERHGLSAVPYLGLAGGFLTGKYRSGSAGEIASPRAAGAAKYATAEGFALIDALENVATERGVAIATVALAWLKAQLTVVAPIASASRVEQVADLVAVAELDLTADELSLLDDASAKASPLAG